MEQGGQEEVREEEVKDKGRKKEVVFMDEADAKIDDTEEDIVTMRTVRLEDASKREKMDKTKSVKDMKKAFDSIAR